MKHPPKTTILIITLFLTAQITGLTLIWKASHFTTSGKPTDPATIIGERPHLTNIGTIIYLTSGILIGTIIVLILAKYKAKRVWKAWFFLAVLTTTAIALGTITNKTTAWILAIIITTLKITKPNAIIHNTSEILTYTGLAIFLTPMLNLTTVTTLLIIMSAYDAYAVWKSKHMITMAKFQAESGMFAGIIIPPKNKITQLKLTTKKTKKRTAILGGGDIIFPMIFTGTAFRHLITNIHLTPIKAYLLSTIIIATTTASLTWLLIKSEKNKFYPALPPITIGALTGLGITILITTLTT